MEDFLLGVAEGSAAILLLIVVVGRDAVHQRLESQPIVPL